MRGTFQVYAQASRGTMTSLGGAHMQEMTGDRNYRLSMEPIASCYAEARREPLTLLLTWRSAS